MNRIHLATALVRRGNTILLVASRYTNHHEPLWHLPGGRQQPGELLTQTALRELREETGLRGKVRELAYVSESYDGQTHFTNFTFGLEADGGLAPADERDHIEAAQWIAIAALSEKIAVKIVLEPLLAYLGDGIRYAGYAEAGISIVFPD